MNTKQENYDYKLIVLGKPTALKRHRTYHKGKGEKMLRFPIKVDPSAEDKKDFVAAVQQSAPPKLIDVPVEITARFFFGRPKSHYRTGKFAGQLKSNAPSWHTTRPDVDNLLKFIIDSLNGVFWRDDTLICSIKEIIKQYSERPRVEIYIKVLDDKAGIDL